MKEEKMCTASFTNNLYSFLLCKYVLCLNMGVKICIISILVQATKIREHKMATERRLKAIEERKRQKRLKKAQEAQKKANAEQEARKTDVS